MSTLVDVRHATVTLPGLGRVPAAVGATPGGRLSLALYVVPMHPAEELVGQEACVEYVSGRGVHRVEGAIVSAPARDTLELEPRGEPVLVQRRGHVRTDAVLPILIAPAEPGSPGVQAHTIDVSGSGILAGRVPGMSAGDEVRLVIELPPPAPPVPAAGTIVRADGQGRIAVHFTQLAAGDQDRLVRFVFERERLARQRLGGEVR